MENIEKKIEQVADLVATSKRIIVFTGAGVSTESGIPDFRSPGGIWSKYDPDDFTIDKFLSNKESRKKHWSLLTGKEMKLTDAKPNPAHYAIAELEKMDKLYGVITQNVDGLHQKGGVSDDMVFQLHGNLSHAKCLSCGNIYPIEEVREWLKEEIDEPQCRGCGGMLKPDAVFFGEQLPYEVLTESERRSRSCDLCFVIGSSLVVYPAALLPMYALQAGAKVVIINEGPTQMDGMAQYHLPGKAGQIMPRIIKRAKEKLGIS
ncbi:MAG: NAD-dependent deacylase [Pseudomonadota bacterium]